VLKGDGPPGRPTKRSVYDAGFGTHVELQRLRRETLDALVGRGCSEGHARAVILVLSELATNAMAHAIPPYRVLVDFDDAHTIVSVADCSESIPSTRAPAFVDGGYGLLLVDALATSWGAVPAAGGKRIWAAVPRTCVL
jgi:hypothetical protein